MVFVYCNGGFVDVIIVMYISVFREMNIILIYKINFYCLGKMNWYGFWRENFFFKIFFKWNDFNKVIE